jgi:hypothetical protein
MHWRPRGTTGRAINLVQVFRVSAVRRPAAEDTGVESDARPIRVSTEELVDMLWTSRPELEKRLPGTAANLNVKSVRLDDVQPCSGGVLARLVFCVNPEVGVPASLAGLSASLIRTVGDLLTESLETPVAVSASPEPGARKRTASSSSERWAPLLALLGTGVGVAGFVTFVGGTIV